MKRFKSIALFSLLLNISSAQDTSKVAYAVKGGSVSGTPRVVKHMGMTNPLPLFPQYPGGNDSLAAFLKKYTRYPKAAKKHNISGVVDVSFTVTVDGSVKNPKIVKSLGYGCDEEAIRIVNLMPKWIPATKGREPMELNSQVNLLFGNQKNKQ